MKNYELQAMIRNLDPGAEVVIFLDPSSDEWIELSIGSVMFSEGQIVLDDCRPVSRSDDWDERRPGWGTCGTYVAS